MCVQDPESLSCRLGGRHLAVVANNALGRVSRIGPEEDLWLVLQSIGQRTAARTSQNLRVLQRLRQGDSALFQEQPALDAAKSSCQILRALQLRRHAVGVASCVDGGRHGE